MKLKAWIRAKEQRHKGCRYRRKSTHKKKVTSEKEVIRREWGHFKKKRKGHLSNPRAKKCWTRLSNKLHRNWVRQCIQRGNWDLHDREYKLFCNPRLWD